MKKRRHSVFLPVQLRLSPSLLLFEAFRRSKMSLPPGIVGQGGCVCVWKCAHVGVCGVCVCSADERI
jgi:hypothetical protein